MPSPPWFPFFPADFDADTGDLSLAEEGLYFRMLRTAWRTSPDWCSLPADPDRLARLLRLTERPVFLDEIIERFWVKKGARLINSRLQKEAKKAATRSRKSSLGGFARAASKQRPGSPPGTLQADSKQPPDTCPEPATRARELQPQTQAQKSLEPPGVDAILPSRSASALKPRARELNGGAQPEDDDPQTSAVDDRSERLRRFLGRRGKSTTHGEPKP